MKRSSLVVLLLLSFLNFAPSTTRAADKQLEKTLSPYFFVSSENAEHEQLPLKHTEAEVHVAGIIADVQVTQVYQNRGTKPLEAIYVFPASTRASVYQVRMYIGERLIEAKIKERQQARREYQAAKAQGKSASLLEQERPNVFRMNVANILPGDEIKVELHYAEVLIPRDGIYEFIYPTVVGPRYSNRPDLSRSDESSEQAENWVKNPYLREGEAPPYTFALRADISAGMPLSDVTSPSHQLKVAFQDSKRAAIELSPEESFGGNRDFVLRYRLADNQISSGVILSENEQENFFLLMLEPPKRLKAEEIVPRDYIFVLDVSGSMYGFPIETAKTLLTNLLRQLRPSDTFNVLLFAGGSSLLSPQPLQATAENLERALHLIDRQQGGGGTELLPALERALKLPRNEQSSRSVILISDGYVDVEKESFELVRDNLGEGNFFSFGIGSSVNRFLIEGLARAGNGEPFVALNPLEAKQRADEFREYIEAPLLSHINVSFEGFDAYEMSRTAVPDLFASKPLAIFGKWRGSAGGRIVVTGRQGQREFRRTIDVSSDTVKPEHSVLRYLWARDRIGELSDYAHIDADSETIAQVTNLGLTYNLLTRYTSFIAVDQIVRTAEAGTTAKQPLPLPQGVADSAVGAEVPTVPEPETWALLALSLLSFAALVYLKRQGTLAA